MRTVLKIANTFLAMTLLIATTGVTLSKHYCMGRLKSVAVFEHAQNCMGNDETDPMPCCKDVSEQFKVEEITISSFDFDAYPDFFLVSSIEWLTNSEASFASSNIIYFSDHSPPPITTDLQSEYQIFLI